MSKRRVVVTGLGTVCPVGNDVETMWENIKNGVCGIDEITHFDTTDFKVKLAGEIKNLNVEDYEKAIDLAPSIKPYRYTYLHNEKYREQAKKVLSEDAKLRRVFHID